MGRTMIKADPERVLRDLYTLRKIGEYKTGVHRPTLSPEDMQARRWLVDQLRAIGHQARIDGIANVLGYTQASGRKMLAGSHLESQNHAGWLDGALGVVYALEAARAVVEAGHTDIGVDVIAFADEEGHFGSFTGSRSWIGESTEADIDAAKDRTTGKPLRQALAEAGLADVPRAKLDASRYRAFLEAHIEQGDSLEADGLKIGVVTGIVAIWNFRLTFEGHQNHAGTTRMAIRRDAGRAMRRFCRHVDARFPDVVGPRSVWTVGTMSLEPGAPSIIPGKAEMNLQFRDADPATLDRMEATVHELVARANAEGPCTVRCEVASKSTPATMHEQVLSALDRAANAFAPARHIRMPSGAGHDAQFMARFMPTGMMFVPSIGGISHHWTENTSDADLMLGAQVYVDAAARILTGRMTADLAR